MYKKSIFLPVYFVLFSLTSALNAAIPKPVKEEIGKQLDLYNLITSKPIEALEKLKEPYNSHREELLKKISSRQKLSDQKLKSVLEETVKKIEKTSTDKHPYFTITECDDPECRLSRSQNPRARELFTQRVVQESAHTKDTAHYVSMGSGRCFLDIQVIMGIIKKNHFKEIAIDFIDTKYLTSYIKEVQSDYTLSNETPLDVPFLFEQTEQTEQIIKLLRNQVPELAKYEDWKLLRNCAFWLSSTALLQSHIKKVFSVLAPETKINLFFHSTVAHYLETKKSADYVIAADIDDYLSLEKESLTAWDLLTTNVLKENKNARCYCLKRCPTFFFSNALIQKISASGKLEILI